MSGKTVNLPGWEVVLLGAVATGLGLDEKGVIIQQVRKREEGESNEEKDGRMESFAAQLKRFASVKMRHGRKDTGRLATTNAKVVVFLSSSLI